MFKNDHYIAAFPRYKAHSEEDLSRLIELSNQSVEAAANAPACESYGYSIKGTTICFLEAWENPTALLAHLEKIKPHIIEEMLKISDVVQVDIHGPEEALEKIRKAVEPFGPTFYHFKYGFRGPRPDTQSDRIT